MSVAQSTLALTIHQSLSSLDLDLNNQGAPTTVLFDPQIPLGARLGRAQFNGQTLKALVESFGSDEHARMRLAVPAGARHLHLPLRGGVNLSVLPVVLQTGARSTAPKIISVHLDGMLLTIEADVCPGHDALLTLTTPWKITDPAYAVRTLRENTYEVRMVAPQSGDSGYKRAKVTLHMSLE